MARAWPARGRLSLGALGLALVLLVSAAWGTGALYLIARLGAASPVGLASIDGIHTYVGIVGGLFVVAKVARVGFGHRVGGVPNVVPWQRWLSWSMLVLYGAVFLTGVLALLPIRGRPYADLVQLHLLTSIWAIPPTTWHVWHYRARALPYLRRWVSRLNGRRFWIGVGLLVLPLPVLALDAPALSELPRVLGGASWAPVPALRGSYLDAVQRLPDGTLLAAGDALYVSHDGLVWLRIDVPAPAEPVAAVAPGGDPHAGHEHGQPAPPNPITAMAVSGGLVLLGTDQGLYATSLSGPMARVAFPGGGVRGLAVDPADPRRVWAASAAGPMLSTDGGATWSRQAAGLGRPASTAAVAFFGGDPYVSDMAGVYRWDGEGWRRSSGASSVTLLSASGGTLYASTATGDLHVLNGGRWTDLGPPAPLHVHDGVVHGQAAAVTTDEGRLYAAGTADGVSASADGGRTWTQLGGGLAGTTPNQVTASGGDLVAATSNGLFLFPLAARSSATPAWWAMLLALALVAGAVAVVVACLDPWRRRGGTS